MNFATHKRICMSAGMASLMLVFALVPPAVAQHIDIAVYQQDGRITLHNSSLPSQPQIRVSRNDFDFWGPPFNIYAGDDPGFQMSGSSAPSGFASLPGGVQLGIDSVPLHIPEQVIGNVLFWDGISDDPEFTSLPSGHDFYVEDAAMNELLLDGGLTRYEGLVAGVTDAGGGLHEHMTFAVENGGSAPQSGFYLMGWRFSTPGLDESELSLVALTTPSIPSQVKSQFTSWLSSQVNVIRMVGDFDDNGLYELADIDALVAQVVAGVHEPEYDLTLDGQVEIDDINLWREIAGSVLNSSGSPIQVADANLDGSVDGADFLIWNSAKLSATSAWSLGDFNADGTTDGADFALWSANKFQSANSLQAVPEPAVAGYLFVSLILCVFYIRR